MHIWETKAQLWMKCSWRLCTSFLCDNFGKRNVRWRYQKLSTRGWCTECDPYKIDILMHLLADTRSLARSLADSLHEYVDSEPITHRANPKHFNT